MATLLNLVEADQLLKLDPMLGVRQQELRRIYMLPRLATWLDQTLPGLGSTWNIEERPIEQLDALAAQFCAGEPLAYGHRFKPLTHLGEGVWELKTADLRVFGWFHQQDCFVGTDCNLKRVIVDLHMYGPYCEQAARFRGQLDLDEPKFLPGEEPDAVVSNFYYP